MQTILLNHISELNSTAKAILAFAQEKKIFCFYGELGAGKTTLIKTICKTLNAKDSGSSPTYGLVNEYETNSGNIIYHFDLYRINNEAEAFDFGFEEYIHSGNYCFIEWPEKVAQLLPRDHINVVIEVKDQQRIISLS